MRFTTPVIAMTALAATQKDVLLSGYSKLQSWLKSGDSTGEAPSGSEMTMGKMGIGGANLEPRSEKMVPEPNAASHSDETKRTDAKEIQSSDKSRRLANPDVTRVDGVTKLPEIPDSNRPKLLPVFLRTFDKNLQMKKRKLRPDPDRGNIVIQGLVEILGTKSLVTLDVITEYDIEEDKFHNLDIFIRSMRPVVQKPRKKRS
jgi:hypothetical protein